MAESACLQCISWGFNWRNRAFQAFLTPNWHFWQMTQISDKCLLCKTEKTQISGQTQIIWVRWSLWVTREGAGSQGDTDCDAGTSAAATLIDWSTNWSATTRQREKKGSLCTDYPLIHDCFGFFVSRLIHEPSFCCLSWDGWWANWVWLRAMPLSPSLLCTVYRH